MTEWNTVAADALERVRQQRVLVHNITNYVVMNYSAMALLAAGASPVMAHAQEEVEEMAGIAGALVLNIGTLEPSWIASMGLAGRAANRKGIPVVLDPVGSGATRYRTDCSRRLLREVAISIVRGNASEILSLSPEGAVTRGVDAAHGVEDAERVAGPLARELRTVLAVTGAVDLVTDGGRSIRIEGGHELMGRVTGTGCVASALVAAFAAVQPDGVLASAGALAYFKLAGEWAARRASAPGSFQVALLDALAEIQPQDVRNGARIHEIPA